MRQLKHHEYKLLKKSDFLQWKREGGRREATVCRRYYVQDAQDYTTYSKVVGKLQKLALLLKALPEDDMMRIRFTDDMLNKLFDAGFIAAKNGLDQVSKMTVSAICRRRLPVMLVRLNFAETLNLAVRFIEQGHIRIGPKVITDPAILVTRNMEDFITWADGSKIQRKVVSFNEKRDDYDLDA
ncbi:U3 small nucleolar ribonucleoprotein IMP3 [Porphyridium purpureum]|uniref:U3 small nucleolar ribonucleoprotein protein IMP3 n=1 Tax=Porphyridium purpureum TaxID=35688 RepID=A0A5J4YXP6_PORPP|nr:U3 small nucleolar ribonucleoprotein IMP3 [Porphyridium purpureum]|eukprot:POR6607..scf209_3